MMQIPRRMFSRIKCLSFKLLRRERPGRCVHKVFLLLSLFLMAIRPRGLASVSNPVLQPPQPILGSSSRMVVAILTFENRTRNPSLDFWHLAPEWLIAESLGKLPTIRVESGEGFALHELHHESYNAIDAAQARKMGEILEVRRVIWGAYEQ